MVSQNAQQEHVYHAQDAVSAALKATTLTGGVGLFASAVQNTLTKQNVGPMGVFIKSGGTIGIFAAMGGSYEFVKTASANLREKKDHWNVALGGFVSGSLLGLRARSFPALLGYGTGLAITMSGFDYVGGLWGHKKDSETDEFERRTQLRRNYRQPGEETVAQLGEGRGVYGPGYAERRQQRIKDAYGYDVPTTQVPAS